MSDRLPVPYDDHSLDLGARGDDREEHRLRRLLCHVGQMLHTGQYVAGTSGSLSARLDSQRILITPPHAALGFMQPEHLIPLSPDEAAASPYHAARLHLACYQQRPDIASVIYAHPRAAVALTLAGISLRTCVIPEAVIVLGLVPTAAYQSPGSPEALAAVQTLIAEHDALLFAHDGALTVGADALNAYLRMELLEHTANILERAARLAPIPPLPPAQVAALLEIRRASGYWRPGDEARFCAMCGVC